MKLVFTLRFWNNIHQVCSRTKDWKTNWFIRRWEQTNPKRSKQENESSLMSEGGDPKRKRNPIKNGQSSDTGTGNHEHSNLKMKTNKIKKNYR